MRGSGEEYSRNKIILKEGLGEEYSRNKIIFKEGFRSGVF